LGNSIRCSIWCSITNLLQTSLAGRHARNLDRPKPRGGRSAYAELLEAIIYNDDNLTYGNIVSIYVGPDETITALTDDGIEELTDMIRAARITSKTWHEFLDDFVDDTNLAARIKAK
jgi:hypothetical protein